MVIIVSKDWRRIAQLRKMLSVGNVRGCSSLEELSRIGKSLSPGEKNLVIIDRDREMLNEEQVLALLREAGITASVWFADKRSQCLSSNWNILEDPNLLSYTVSTFTPDYHASSSPYRLIGQSDVMEKVRRQIALAATMDCPVHIYGETGTGKEIAAHLLSPSLVVSNCSEFSSTLGACRLFGVKKGAYTDATEEAGLVELANGSALFLDEIEDLRPDVQGLLLRLIENGTYQRVGETKTRTTKFRLITASNVPLRRLVASSRLRKDLFYRINGMTITMPPLRKHRQDIPSLVSFFLAGMGEKRSVEDEGMDLLMAQAWEGNVRQLFAALRQNVALSAGREKIHIEEGTVRDEEQE